MHFLDLTLPTPAENLALDEALLLEAEAGSGGEVLRLWEWPGPAVVLGAGGRVAEDVEDDACRADGVPVLRRASGGGTVLLGRGCLLFTLVLAYERAADLTEISTSYRYILGRIAAALAERLAGVEQAGVSDLAVAGRKFSGNAQQRKRRHLLHHGTLLYDFELGRIGTYLRQPARQPKYRGGRPHQAFVTNLGVERGELERRLRSAWGAEGNGPIWPADLVARLVEEKYARPEWVRRR